MRYRFGRFELDTGSAQVTGPAGPVPLRPMTLKLLQCLVEQAPDLLTHDSLLDRVWGRQAVSPGVVAQSVRELRKALGDPVQGSIYIETKHRLGYRFIATVERVGDADSRTSTAITGTPTPSHSPRGSLHPLAWLGLSLAALLMAWWLWPGASTPTGESSTGIEILGAGRPGEPEARTWFEQGLTALQRGQDVHARDLLAQSLAREPRAPATLAALAGLEAERGELTRARSLAGEALAAGQALPRRERLRLEGLNARLDDRWDEAIASFQALFQLDPGDAGAGFRLFEAQLAAGQSQAAAQTLANLAALPEPLLDGVRLALAQSRLANLRADHGARHAAAERAFGLARSARERAEARLEQGWALALQGQGSDAAAALQAARDELFKADWPGGQVRAAMLEATVLRETSDFAAAIETFESAAALADAAGDSRSAAAARREAAFALSESGASARALAQIEELLPVVEAAGDRRELASTLDVLAIAQQRSGDQAGAQATALRALETYVTAGDRGGEAAVRTNLGMLYGRLGRAADAQEQLEKAQAAFVLTGNRRGAAVALSNLAILYGRAGRSEAAREANESALADFRAVGARLDIARLQFNLGIQDRRAGDLSAAQSRLQEALDGFEAVRSEDFRLAAVASLADLLLLRADAGAAEALLARAAESVESSPQRAAALASVQGRLAMQRGEPAQAGEHFAAALRLREQAGLAGWVRASRLDLAELAARSGDLATAEQAARSLRREMLEAGEARDAAGAALLLAAILTAEGRAEAAERLLDEIEADLLQDAHSALRADLVRASGRGEGREPALAAVAERARAQGFEWLALRAERLAGGDAGQRALASLAERGLSEPGSPVLLPL